jgi:high-affinity Fe2+/Pb2+ permease
VAVLCGAQMKRPRDPDVEAFWWTLASGIAIGVAVSAVLAWVIYAVLVWLDAR